jgi:hypothetical protein
MLTETMEVGDQVIIRIPRSLRDGGYDPCPDGTRAEVVGFAEIYYGRIDNFGNKPGVYVNRAWVKVRLPDGKEYYESVANLQYRKRPPPGRRRQWGAEFIRELPKTPFWEGDFVRVNGGSVAMQIVGIDYDHLAELTLVGTRYPAYRVSSHLGAGWHEYANDDAMELVERGPVWKFFHDEPVRFSDIKAEAQFFEWLGHTDEVRNPASGRCDDWTKDEVLAAIQRGSVHGFSVSTGFFGSGPSISAIRFRNEELGQRVARATLQGFGLVQA